MGNKVVAALLDGRRIKGSTANFYQDRDQFHVTTPDGKVVELRLEQLKAVFFVKSLDGDRTYHEQKGFAGARGAGRKVRCEFHDGEVLTGFTPSYSPARLGFFLTPTDPKSNNQRSFVIIAATKLVTLVP